MIKKYNQHIKENLDYEEEQDEPIFRILGFYVDLPSDNSFCILQEYVDEDTMILFSGFRHHAKGVWKACKFISNEDIEKYIYSNKLPINIWNVEINDWNKIYWKDIPNYIKDNL